MLEEQRAKIDAIDQDIVRLFEERMNVVLEVAKFKQEHQIPILDESREQAVYQKVTTYLKDKTFHDALKQIYTELMRVSKEYQKTFMAKQEQVPKRNEMMDRPIIQQNIIDYLRTKQRQFDGVLAEIQREANVKRIPIIPHETALFLDFLMGQLKPKHILEIGTAVGFSGLLMAQHLSENGSLHTIDRFDVMIAKAKENFKRSDKSQHIVLLEGDAEVILPTLTPSYYDVIFMDSAKAKYYTFLPHCMTLLKTGGILIVDDVFQAGTIFEDEQTIPKRTRKIHRELNKFMHLINEHPSLKATTLPLGDGLVIIEKLAEY